LIRIHNRFIGGNICVKKQTETDAFLENELRDTQGDWFYWAFCVEGAQGKTMTFHLQEKRIGHWGPAVSNDLKNWHWLEDCGENNFTYCFGDGEKRVYFAHHMLYHPDRFSAFAESHGLCVSRLCESRKGRSVPCISFGKGTRNLLFTARHHACESTGSYVLEGVLEELLRAPIQDTRVFCVPFVDYDGVIDGDQGKNRVPHDQNRDYIDSPIYPEVEQIKRFADERGIYLAVDFHAPGHKGGRHDTIYIVQNNLEKNQEFQRFSSILQDRITPDSMQYSGQHDYPHNTGWNIPSANFGYTMNRRAGCKLAFTLENAYFGTAENKVSAERLIELGRCVARALKEYGNEDKL